MGKPIDEIWRPVPLDFYADAYEISNWGRVRSIVRTITKMDRWGNYYDMNIGGNIISFRTNGTEPHTYSSITKKVDGKHYPKTVYPHKLCAMAFNEPSRDPKATKVIVKNGVHTDIWPDNLQWVSQSYLSTKIMAEAPPERRNWIGKYQVRLQKKNLRNFKKIVSEGYTSDEAQKMLGLSDSWMYLNDI